MIINPSQKGKKNKKINKKRNLENSQNFNFFIGSWNNREQNKIIS